MSLIYGHSSTNTATATEGAASTKTHTTSITFTRYNNRRTVKVFDHGIVLLGLVASSVDSAAHSGLVFYNVYDTSGDMINDIRTHSGNYFQILNSDNDDAVLELRSVYTIPRPCSIMVKLGSGSRRGGVEPPSPVTLNITVYYVHVPTVKY